MRLLGQALGAGDFGEGHEPDMVWVVTDDEHQGYPEIRAAWHGTDWGIGVVRSFTYRLYVFHGIAYPPIAASSCHVPIQGTGRVVARLVVGSVTAFPGRSLRWLRSLHFWACCLAAEASQEKGDPAFTPGRPNPTQLGKSDGACFRQPPEP